QTLKEEAPKFRVAIDALPEDKHAHKVHEKSREAGNLAAQLALQWKAISGILTAGAPNFDPHEMEKQSKADMLVKFDEGMDQLLTDTEAISDQEWENSEASMGPAWSDKKFKMSWGFLFDAIHHRGQLATYLRAMGAIVPSIYGPSADTKN
ncbi:MAG: DinB family protein, partial [Candidatus Paceibacterota bacterium]